MKKLLFSIGLCLVITLSFIGCTKTDTSKDTTTQKTSEDTSKQQTTTDKNSSQNDDSKSQIKDSQSKDSSSQDNTQQSVQKSQKQLVGKVTFCESVDSNLNPINTSTRFTTGQIYARLQSSTPFNTSRIKITLIYVDGASEFVLDSSVQDSNPAWTIFAFPVTTVDTGTYKVIIMDDINNTKLGEGTFAAEGI